ncbi:MAG: fatty acid desaturase [Actinomycetota bacterium]
MSTTSEVSTPSANATGSLKPVLDIIPDSVYDNPTWRGLSYFGRDTVMYVGLLVALVFVTNVFEVLALEIAMALVISGLFIVGHDAAHGALFKSKRINSLIGHLSMLPSLHVFEGWILGHNRMHHAFTVRQGYDFVWEPTTPAQFEEMNRFKRLIHRIEWSWFGAGLYFLHQVWWKKMIVGKTPARWTRSVNRDRVIVGAFFLAMLGLFGAIGAARTHSIAGVVWIDLRTVVLPFLAFIYVIGSFVHVHHVAPDIRWWRKADWTKFKAQVEGTTVLRAPRGLNFFIHWIMVHVPHHVDMRIPMYRLEEAAAAIKENFPDVVHEGPLRFRDFISNSRKCKIYDFDAGAWLTYRDARRLVRA